MDNMYVAKTDSWTCDFYDRIGLHKWTIGNSYEVKPIEKKVRTEENEYTIRLISIESDSGKSEVMKEVINPDLMKEVFGIDISKF